MSIEAGVESLTREGRATLDKNCRMTTDELAERLILAKRHVPFVQANLIEVADDDDDAGRRLARPPARAGRLGQRAGAAVPLSRLARLPHALGRARRAGLGAGAPHYLEAFDAFSDIQDERPLPLEELERACRCA